MKKSLSYIINSVLAVGVIIFFGYVASVSAVTGDVTGYACSQNIGCISLNSQISTGMAGFGSQPGSFAVQYNSTAGEFSGTGWNPLIGAVNFGVPCPAPILNAQGASAAGNKCASVPLVMGSSAVQNGGWDGYIYLGGVTLDPDGVHFNGRGWEGYDTNGNGATPSDTGIGWLDFAVRANPVVLHTDNASVTLITTTPTILSGGTGHLIWTTSNVTACTATAALGPSMSGIPVSNPWTALSSADLVAMVNGGNIDIPGMTTQTTFLLVCTDNTGASIQSSPVTIDVNDPAECLGENPPAWCDLCASANPPAWCEGIPGGKLKPIYKEN